MVSSSSGLGSSGSGFKKKVCTSFCWMECAHCIEFVVNGGGVLRVANHLTSQASL